MIEKPRQVSIKNFAYTRDARDPSYVRHTVAHTITKTVEKILEDTNCVKIERVSSPMETCMVSVDLVISTKEERAQAACGG
jgi:hypothetical protein